MLAESPKNRINADLAMTLDSKLGHMSETQTPQELLASEKYIHPRKNGNLQYRRRYPTDLRNAGVYNQADFKKSLGTKDRKKARRLALTQTILLDEEFEQKRREIKLSTTSTGQKLRPLAALSDLERWDFILRQFVRLEKRAFASGWRDHSARSRENGDDVFYTAISDFNVYSGSPNYEPIDWRSWLEQSLNEEDIKIEEKGEARLSELCNLFKRAYIESAWRTCEALEGNPSAERDRRVKGVDFDTSLSSKDGITIGKLCTSYVESKKAGRVKRASLNKYSMQVRVLKDFWGEGKALASITVDDACRLAKFLGQIPNNATKRYGTDLSLMDAGKREDLKKKPCFISPKTQQDYLVGLTAIFNYAVDMDWIPANPLGKKVVANRLPLVTKRKKEMMTTEEMTLIFSSTRFLSERDKLSSDGNPNQARFWVPLLCLFHGLRSNEACQLLVSDVKEDKGITFLAVRETDDDDEKRKQLKTGASERMVPLHSNLIRMGFLDFVKVQRETKEDLLFPELKADRKGSKADALGKWFSRLRLQVLTNRPPRKREKTLHSFRHSFAHAARNAGEGEGMLDELGGLSRERHRNSAADYGSGFSLKRLKEAIDKVEYPGVDFSAIYNQAEPQVPSS